MEFLLILMLGDRKERASDCPFFFIVTPNSQ